MKVLIVGGSRGIGACLTRLLSKEGDEVFFTYHRSETQAEALEKETGAKKIRYDQNSEQSIASLCDFARSGRLEGLVNAAAEPYKREPLLQMSAEEYFRYVTQGVKGAFLISQAFVNAAKENKTAGSIVNVLSSVVLGIPPEKQSSYVGLKYLLWGLSQSQAAEFKAYQVRVNCVAPGMTRTDFISDLPARFIEMYEQTLPMKRIATPEEVAGVIRFLLSPASSYMSGANIPVTGGLSC